MILKSQTFFRWLFTNKICLIRRETSELVDWQIESWKGYQIRSTNNYFCCNCSNQPLLFFMWREGLAVSKWWQTYLTSNCAFLQLQCLDSQMPQLSFVHPFMLNNSNNNNTAKQRRQRLTQEAQSFPLFVSPTRLECCGLKWGIGHSSVHSSNCLIVSYPPARRF